MVFSDVFLGFLNQHKHPEDTYNTNGPTDRATLVFLKDQVFSLCLMVIAQTHIILCAHKDRYKCLY